MLLVKLDIKNKLVLIFQEGMNKKKKKKNIKQQKNEVKKQVQKKPFFYITRPVQPHGSHIPKTTIVCICAKK